MPMRPVALLFLTLILQACAAQTTHVPAATSLPRAPWNSAVLNQADIPPVFLAQWRKAENSATCAPFAFLKTAAGAQPRAATFSGGWAVAYDMPTQRSAFGIAGTGSSPADATYTGWTHHIEWADGSRADYGLEGGTGPNQLAYLRIAGQGCLYNVWSRISREHLEELLGAIRRIERAS